MKTLHLFGVTAFCTFLCSCERQRDAGKVYNLFDPKEAAFGAAANNNLKIVLVSESHYWSDDTKSGVLVWRFKTDSKDNTIIKFTHELGDQIATDLTAMDASIEGRSQRGGSVTHDTMSYNLEERRGTVTILTSPHRLGADIEIRLRETEQVASCNPLPSAVFATF